MGKLHLFLRLWRQINRFSKYSWAIIKWARMHSSSWVRDWIATPLWQTFSLLTMICRLLEKEEWLWSSLLQTRKILTVWHWTAVISMWIYLRSSRTPLKDILPSRSYISSQTRLSKREHHSSLPWSRTRPFLAALDSPTTSSVNREQSKLLRVDLRAKEDWLRSPSKTIASEIRDWKLCHLLLRIAHRFKSFTCTITRLMMSQSRSSANCVQTSQIFLPLDLSLTVSVTKAWTTFLSL